MTTALPVLRTDDIEHEQASHVASLSNLAALHADGIVPGGWWHRDGDRGFCFVRQNIGGEMMLTTYGRSTGFCIDPIEKKPLNHFLPHQRAELRNGRMQPRLQVLSELGYLEVARDRTAEPACVA